MPANRLLFLEDGAAGYVGRQGAIPAFVECLNSGDVLKRRSDVREAFFPGHVFEFGVEVAPLHLFAVGGFVQVGQRITDDTGRIRGGDFHVAAFQVFKKHLGVFLFIGGRFRKDIGNLLVAFLTGLAGEERVAVPGL